MNQKQLTLVNQLHIYIYPPLYQCRGKYSKLHCIISQHILLIHMRGSRIFLSEGFRRGPKGYSVLPGDGRVLGTYSEINYLLNKKFEFSRKCPEPPPPFLRIPPPRFPSRHTHAYMQLNRSSTSIICAIHYVLMYNTTVYMNIQKCMHWTVTGTPIFMK